MCIILSEELNRFATNIDARRNTQPVSASRDFTAGTRAAPAQDNNIRSVPAGNKLAL